VAKTTSGFNLHRTNLTIHTWFADRKSICTIYSTDWLAVQAK